jgi:hypothetical protein
MTAIIPFFKNDCAFGQHDITSMSMALDDVCKELKIADSAAREIIAIRIIEIARRGERSPTKLRDRVLGEASAGTGC